MAVSSPPFQPVVRIFPGGNPIDATNWGAGYDISSYVRHPGSDGGAPITYSIGRPDEATDVDPGQLTMTLNNRDGRFSTRNPNGPYYPDLRRGTPITLATLSGQDTFTRTVSNGLGTSSGGGVWTSSTIWSTDGSSGQAAIAVANFASVPTLAGADSLTFEGRITVWPTVAATGAALIYAIWCRAADSSNGTMLSVEFHPASVVQVKIRRADSGVNTTLASATLAATYSANDKFRLRVQVIGSYLRVKAWKPANPSSPDDDEPTDWSTTAQDDHVPYGTAVGLYFWRVLGNTNVGTVNFKMDDFSVEAIEWMGSVSEWPVRWNITGGNCWAPITANGPLRRIRQSGSVVESSLRQQLVTESPTAYWPLEDDSGATSYGSALPGIPAAVGINTTAAGDSTLLGAKTAPVMNAANARITGVGGAAQTGTKFAVIFLAKFPAATPAADTVIAWVPQEQTGTNAVVMWQLWVLSSGANVNLKGYDRDGVLVVNTTVATAGTITSWANWMYWQVKAEVVGGSTTYTVWYNTVGDENYWALTGTYANTSNPRCRGATLGGGSVDQVAYSQLWIGEDSPVYLSATGYNGEWAADRISRLCAQEGITCEIEASEDPSLFSSKVGPQQYGNFLDALRSAAEADYGILYEYGTGVAYRVRDARYMRDVDLALTVASGQVAEPPEPTDDDQRVVNDFTASRVDGSSARVYDTDHVDAEGRYAGSASLLVYEDAMLPDYAGFRVYLGTRPDLRWPSIKLNFARTPTLLTAWRQAGYAPRMTVTTGMTQVATSDPDVIIEGYSATLSPTEWIVDANCSPAKPWDIDILTVGDVRLDTAGSTLDPAGSGVTTTGTSWVVVTTTGPIWSPTATNPSDVPFTLTCEGEEVSVTNVGSLSGGKQTLTVTRSTNGVVKAHAAGAAISLAEPTYLAM